MEAARQLVPTTEVPGAGSRIDDVRDAALTLFAQWGYHGTTMSQIAAALGVRVPTLYSHIRSKQELLAEIMLTTSTQVWEDYEQATQQAEGVINQLQRAVEVYVLRHATHRREAVIVNRDVSSLDEPTRSKVLSLRRRHEHAIRDIIDTGCATGTFAVQTPSLASFAILEMGVGVARWFHDDGLLTADIVAKQYGQLALNLVAAPHRDATTSTAA